MEIGSLKDRLIRNFSASLYAIGVTLTTQFLSVPLYLHFWGSLFYGEWLVLSAVAGYVALTDVGFTKVASNEVAMRVACGDFDSANAYLQSAWLMILGASGCVLFSTLVLVPFLPLAHWLHITTHSSQEVTWTALLLIIYTLLCLHTEIFGTVYRAMYHNARGAMIGSTLRLFDFIIAAGVVVICRSFVLLSLSLVIWRILGTLFLYWDSFRLAPRLMLGWKHARWIHIRDMLRPSLAFMCFPIGHSIPSQAMTLVVNAALGPKAVVIFNAVRMITRTLILSMNLVKNAVWVEMSRLVAISDWTRSRKLHRFAVGSTVSLISLGALALFFFGQPILSWWTHGVVSPARTILAIFVIEVVLNSIWLSSSVVLEATNQHEQLAYRFLAASCCALGLSFILVPRLGIAGTAWSLMAVDLLLIPFVLRHSTRILQDSPQRLSRWIRVKWIQIIRDKLAPEFG